jgi:eukaryotic-like serine/threonine-protein kinase
VQTAASFVAQDALMTADPKNCVSPDTAETGASISLVCTCGKKVLVRAEDAGDEIRCGDCRSLLVGDPFTTTLPPRTESIAEAPPQAAAPMQAAVPEQAAAPVQAAVPMELEEMRRGLQGMLTPPQAADEIGRLGPYRILQVLGMGGMGVVFKAQDSRLVRFVAVKAMLPWVAEKASAKNRFLREARAAAALKHDHVVGIFDVGEERGVPYLAMEYLDGESLEDCLKREGRLPIGDALRIGREIADGLGAAHELGLIHRDIKPANVWLEKRSIRRKDGQSDSSIRSTARVKILDFGLARGAEDASITQTGAVLGTPAYMSLEQAQGEQVDARCDLYSLGVVLYRMVTGKLPFGGSNLFTVLAAMVTGTLIEPSKLNPNVPAKLNDLIVRLLSKNADKRPASASEVYAALSGIEEVPADSEAVASPMATAALATRRPDSPASTHVPESAAPPRKRSKSWSLFAVALGSIAAVALVCEFIPRPPISRDGEPVAAKELARPADKVPAAELGATVEVPPPKADPPLVKVEPKSVPVPDTKPVPAVPEIAPVEAPPPKEDSPLKKIEPKSVPVPDVKPAPPPPEIANVEVPPPKPDPPLKKVEPKRVPVPDTKPAPPPPALQVWFQKANSIGMKLVSIPPGKFMMGSPPGEKERNKDHPEKEDVEVQHEVEITKAFWLGKYEVTQEEYEKVMGSNPSNFKGSKLPVENVSWNEAKQFCRKLSIKEGKTYTLPTEAEWEYACRGGTTGPFSTGKSLTSDQANFKGEEYRQKTTKVGSFAANGFGLHDMHGNVAEWCEDWWREYDKDGLRLIDPLGPSEGSSRVYRGGSFLSGAGSCRSASRLGYPPTTSSISLGFRVALRSEK